MKRFDKYFTLKYALLSSLIFAPLMALIAFVWDAPRILASLQANPFGSLLDSVVLVLAFIMLTFILYGSFLGGQLGAWLWDRIFDATLLAIVQMQRLPANTWQMGKSFFRLVVPAIQHVPADFLLHRWFEKYHLVYPLAKLPSRSTLPYELFPVSCILLN